MSDNKKSGFMAVFTIMYIIIFIGGWFFLTWLDALNQANQTLVSLASCGWAIMFIAVPILNLFYELDNYKLVKDMFLSGVYSVILISAIQITDDLHVHHDILLPSGEMLNTHDIMVSLIDTAVVLGVIGVALIFLLRIFPLKRRI